MQASVLDPDRRIAWPERAVACVRLPYFLVRVELLRHPDWDGRPIVLGGASGQRKVVQYCSPEAEHRGIRPGLPLREVLSLAPDAIIRQPDPAHAATVLDEVLGALQRVSPSVEAGDGQFFLDLHGLEALYRGSLTHVERAIRAAVPSLLRPWIGVARGKLLAQIAAQVAPAAGMHVAPDDGAASFLAPLPIALLPLGPDVLKRLEVLGLRTIADLAALPFSAVQAEFGPAGALAWRLARGQDRSTVVPHRTSRTMRASLNFDHPLASIDAILAALGSLLASVFGDPTLRGRAVRQAQLHARLSDGASWERLVTFKEAVATSGTAHAALKTKLELPNALPEAPIEELALEVLGFGGEGGKQQSLFSTRARRQAEVVEATRQLHARYGHTPLYRALEVEPWSRVPERRWALIPYEP